MKVILSWLMRYAKVIILTLTVIGSIFVNSSLLTDSQILPKWFCFAIGGALLAFVMGFQLLQGSVFESLHDKNIIARIIGLSIVAQVIYAIACYHSWWSQDVVFEIGSFENPAGFASCLCMGMPFVALFVRDQKRWVRSIALVSCFLVLIAIYVSKSRTGYVSCVMMLIVFLLFIYNKVSRRARVVLCVGCFSAVVGIVIAFCSMSGSKHNSMNGRKLIWTVGMEMVKDKPLNGHGLGSIERCYMNYQAGYLKHSSKQSEIMLADNVKHVFNDYLAIAIQFGLVGILLLFGYVGMVAYCFIRKSMHDSLAQAALLSMIGLGSFAFFSYPSCYPFTWVMIAVNSWLIISPCIPRRMHISVSLQRTMGMGMVILSVVSLVQIGIRLKAELTWKKLYDRRLVFGDKQTLSEYQSVYAVLKHEPYFLYNYAVELNLDGQYAQSQQVAKECERYWADYDLKMVMAYNYKDLRNSANAIRCFHEAEAMCPNRFEPIYNIMQIYQSLHNSRKTLEYAKMIVNKSIKVYSADVVNMKDEAKQVLSNQEVIMSIE